MSLLQHIDQTTILYGSAILAGLLALLVSIDLFRYQPKMSSKAVKVILCLVLFIVLYGIILAALGFLIFAECGGAGACGWVLVGYFYLFLTTCPIGVVLALIAFAILLVVSGKVEQTDSSRLVVSKVIGAIIIALVVSAGWIFVTSATPQRSYNALTPSLKPSTQTTTFGEKYSFSTGGNIAGDSAYALAVSDIDGDGKNEIVYLTKENAQPSASQGYFGTLHLTVASADGTLVRNCLVDSGVFFKQIVKTAKFGSVKNAVYVVTSQYGKKDPIPALHVIDPRTCTALADKIAFSGAGYNFTSGDIYNLEITNNVVSFHGISNKCEYTIGSPVMTAVCTPESYEIYDTRNTNSTYSPVEKQVIEKIGTAEIRDFVRTDLDGDGQAESIFFVRPTISGEFVTSEKVVVANTIGDIVGVWETKLEVEAKAVADVDGDGKNEILVYPYSGNGTKIIVLGFK